MADRLKRLERELGLAAAPAPFPMDPKIICRRVEATLSAEERERKCYMKHKIRLAALLTAAVLALTGTALAAGPTLAQALHAALGSFAPYAYEQEHTVVDAGIRVKVLSALADQGVVRVYAELTDLTDDRLEDANIHGTIDLNLEGESSFGSGSTLICYDKETRTALIRFDRETGVPIPEATETTLRINNIRPGLHTAVGQDITSLEGLTTAPIPSQVLPTGETVLVPSETERELPGGGGVTLAAVGFGGDGRFHTLFHLPSEALLDHTICWAIPQAQPEAGRLNPFWGATKGESGRSPHTEDGAYDMVYTAFEQDGKKYYDVSYVHRPGGPELPEYLDPVFVRYATMEPVEGTWEVPVTIRRLADVASPLSGQIDNNTLQELTLSPYGVIIRSTSTDWTLIEGYPLTVFLQDGTLLRPRRGEIGTNMDPISHSARWEFEDAVEVENITGVALGCWMIPVENGIAGEGYWLPALPE